MICKQCRMGGDLSAELRATTANGFVSNPYPQAINDRHGQCKGRSWCDCQHAGTPHALRAESHPARA